MQFFIIKSIIVKIILLVLVLSIFTAWESAYAKESTLKIDSYTLKLPITIIPPSTGNLFIDSEPRFNENIQLPSFKNPKKWLQAYMVNEIEGIGMAEVIQFQCQRLGKQNIELCLIYWQWSQSTTWTVIVDVVDIKGNIISRESFGRYGAYIGLLPYEHNDEKSKLLIMERGIHKPGDTNCCPTGKQLETYQWHKKGLTLLSSKTIEEK